MLRSTTQKKISKSFSNKKLMHFLIAVKREHYTNDSTVLMEVATRERFWKPIYLHALFSGLKFIQAHPIKIRSGKYLDCRRLFKGLKLKLFKSFFIQDL